MKIQRQTLIDNYIPLSEVKEIVYQKRRNLWEREIEQPDFLDLRLGVGSTELKSLIKIPVEHFSLKDDNLLILDKFLLRKQITKKARDFFSIDY